MSIRKTFLGAAAMSSASIFRLVMQFLAIPILARLLSPSDYGIASMAMPFVIFSLSLADAGIGISLVRCPEQNEQEWSSSFWMTIAAGFALTILLAAVSPLAAMALSEPEVAPVLASLSFVILLQSISTIPGAKMQRDQRYGVIARIEVIAITASLGSAVLIAYYGGGAWALVTQQLVFYAVRMLLTLIFSTFKPIWKFSPSIIKHHAEFGLSILSANILSMITSSCENWIIGRNLGSYTIGTFSMAMQLCRLPIMLVTGPLGAPLYSHLSRIDNISHVRETFLLLTRMMSMLIFPAMAVSAVASEPLIHTLLSQKWTEAAHIYAYMAPAAAIQTVVTLSNAVLMALGKPRLQMRCALEYMLIWVPLLLFIVSFGINTVAISYSVILTLYNIRKIFISTKYIGISLQNYMTSLLPAACISIIAVYLYYTCEKLLNLNEIYLSLISILIIITTTLLGFLGDYKTIRAGFASLKENY